MAWATMIVALNRQGHILVNDQEMTGEANLNFQDEIHGVTGQKEQPKPYSELIQHSNRSDLQKKSWKMNSTVGTNC